MTQQYTHMRIPPQDAGVHDWYQTTILAGKIARHSGTPGCQILGPNGAELWHRITVTFDDYIMDLGYDRMAYPALFPMSLLEKEKDHVEGFAPELAVIRELKGEKLDDPLVLRPTSEVVIYQDMSQIVQSKADLPIKVNQWCNVFRVEMRTRLLTRTFEFFWHEAHWAIEDELEAHNHTLAALDQYVAFIEDHLAIPVIAGEKTALERFAGADRTYTVETRMLDGKALQSGTSHMMGKGFAQTYEISYDDGDGGVVHPVTGSWGMSTRILGAIVMTHSDDKGLVFPPKIAPWQCVIMSVPSNKEGMTDKISDYSTGLAAKLKSLGVRYKNDGSDERLGKKQFHWEKQGIPVRIIVGGSEVDNGVVSMKRRDTGESLTVPLDDLDTALPALLEKMQSEMFDAAKEKLTNNTIKVSTLSDFKEAIARQDNAFMMAGWCNEDAAEEALKDEYGYTVRCIPFSQLTKEAHCFLTGKPAKVQALIAKAY
ncbi:prolyl-tRNA synthetase [Yoonia maricola]|uniref:Proline--tRNA ligase n=1 Tax=Yoonia maricola TaxID=420999 RepID=A0A2M8W5L0_9RHOB|nr:proline--tRNA ligase [Yoonia maricola]PJI86213.1 prolyl-tRNA synthetase [Yoonia maricola]